MADNEGGAGGGRIVKKRPPVATTEAPGKARGASSAPAGASPARPASAGAGAAPKPPRRQPLTPNDGLTPTGGRAPDPPMGRAKVQRPLSAGSPTPAVPVGRANPGAKKTRSAGAPAAPAARAKPKAGTLSASSSQSGYGKAKTGARKNSGPAAAAAAAATPGKAKSTKVKAKPAARGGPLVVTNAEPAANGGAATSSPTPPPPPPPPKREPVSGSGGHRFASLTVPDSDSDSDEGPRQNQPNWKPPPPRSARPTDEQAVVCPARKYIYDLNSSRWRDSDTMVRVLHPNRGLSQGGMRVCFSVDELDEFGAGTSMVAKMFRHDIKHVVEKDYFNEGEAQCMCEVFANTFNRIHLEDEGVDKPNISFLQCYVVRIKKKDIPEAYRDKHSGFFSYKTEDTSEVMFVMEPKLDGIFTKYTSNYGDVYKKPERNLETVANRQRSHVLEAAEAFSHFTLVESGGSMLVCDLQGVNDFLTDPQIHTEDGKGLGMGNMGQKGIDKWVESHLCNDICKAMHLTPLNDISAGDKKTKKENYYRRLAEHLHDQAPVRPQDLIPLTKPLELMTEEEMTEYVVRLSQLLQD